jgi:putative ABC transport system permease protein
MEGIKEADAMIQMPYRIKFGNIYADTAITGLPPGSTMFYLKSPEGQDLVISESGIILPQFLKRKLGAQIGDTVELEPLTGTVGKTREKVLGYVEFFMGGRVFMSLNKVQDMVNAGGYASGIMIKFNGTPSPSLISRLYDLPNAATVEYADATRQYIDSMMGFFWVFIIFMLIMGSSLGIAIIFNSVTVNVLQRTRELALMKVVGMSNRWITAELTLENMVIGAAGVLLGIPMGQYIANYFMTTVGSTSEEAMTMNLVILPQSYAIAIVLAFLMLVVSQIPALRQVRKMSLTTALKDWYE